MPKVRKNRRQLFAKKNDSGRRYITLTQAEDISPATICHISRDECTTLAKQPNASILQRNYPHSSLSLLHNLIKQQGFPNWTIILSDTSIQLFTVQQQATCMSLPRIKRTVTVQSNLSWYVYVSGRLLYLDNCETFLIYRS